MDLRKQQEERNKINRQCSDKDKVAEDTDRQITAMKDKI